MIDNLKLLYSILLFSFLGMISSAFGSDNEEESDVSHYSLGKKETAKDFLSIHRQIKHEQKLDLSGNQINDDVAALVGLSLCKTTKLQVLRLENCNLKSMGAMSILASLKVNHSARILHLSHNSIKSWGLANIDETLTTNATLKVLNLSFNEIGPEVADQLQQGLALNTSLKKLNLKSILLDSTATEKIADGLVDNKTLIHLDLSGNKIHNGGAISLRRLFVHNSSLTELNLDNCDIGDFGLIKLGLGIKNNKALKKLYIRSNAKLSEGAVQDFLKSLDSNMVLEEIVADNIDRNTLASLAESGAPFAQYMLAKRYKEEKNVQKAAELSLKAAENGHNKAAIFYLKLVSQLQEEDAGKERKIKLTYNLQRARIDRELTSTEEGQFETEGMFYFLGRLNYFYALTFSDRMDKSSFLKEAMEEFKKVTIIKKKKVDQFMQKIEEKISEVAD